MLNIENKAGNRRADGVGQRLDDDEHTENFGAVFFREEHREVIHHRRKESGFAHAQHKTADIQLQRRAHKAEQGREDAPEINILANQMRGPNLMVPALLGISNRKYPIKKIPEAKPKAEAVRPVLSSSALAA